MQRHGHVESLLGGDLDLEPPDRRRSGGKETTVIEAEGDESAEGDDSPEQPVPATTAANATAARSAFIRAHHFSDADDLRQDVDFATARSSTTTVTPTKNAPAMINAQRWSRVRPPNWCDLLLMSPTSRGDTDNEQEPRYTSPSSTKPSNPSRSTHTRTSSPPRHPPRGWMPHPCSQARSARPSVILRLVFAPNYGSTRVAAGSTRRPAPSRSAPGSGSGSGGRLRRACSRLDEVLPRRLDAPSCSRRRTAASSSRPFGSGTDPGASGGWGRPRSVYTCRQQGAPRRSAVRVRLAPLPQNTPLPRCSGMS